MYSTCLFFKIIMSFKKSDSKIKSFVTEEEAQESSVKRQEEWEKVRRPEDPLERPEKEHRSLFEQLEEQKEKVQQEHDEKYNLKNMIRGIDNDEAAFLEFASQQQAEIDGRRFAITSEVKEFRSEVAQLQTAITPAGPTSPTKEKTNPILPQSKKKSQLELLAGVIKTKRKRSETDDTKQTKAQDSSVTDCGATSLEVDNEIVKKQRPLEESSDEPEATTTTQVHSSEQYPENNSYYNCISSYKTFSIPGLGMYSDSSDSESSSSDSDILPSLFTFSSSSNHK